jgi:hypothetical protein
MMYVYVGLFEDDPALLAQHCGETQVNIRPMTSNELPKLQKKLLDTAKDQKLRTLKYMKTMQFTGARSSSETVDLATNAFTSLRTIALYIVVNAYVDIHCNPS